MKNSDQAMNTLDGVTIVPKPSKELLNERQYLDYRSEREHCLEWLLTFGKDPAKAEGYAKTTVSNRAYRMDQFYRWVWEQEDGYTTNLTHDHADEYQQYLAGTETSNAHKNTCTKAVMMLYKWLHHQRGYDEWEREITFSRRNQSTTPRDYLTRGERTKIRNASLEYGSVPRRGSVSGEERDRWLRYLSQRFEKPMEAVTKDDWEQANSWKIPSLIATSLDGGLRPIEVERARTRWVDIENEVLRIPKEDSSKNTENWIVGLQSRTVEMLDNWLEQRKTRGQYDDTDALWLTRQGNPYQSATLGRLLRKLCDIADISTENRQMSWYAIRHSTGTYMAREEGLAAAQTQLRHKTPETTMKYDQAPVEDRQNALDRMG